MDCRDAKTAQIARRLAEHRRRMLNLAVQLQALYQGRGEDVAALVRRGVGGGAGAGVRVGAGARDGEGESE